MQGQTINWYHFVTKLKQTHDVRVHHMAFRYGTSPEYNILDDTDRLIPDDSCKANKSAASVHWPNTKCVMKL